MFYIFHGEDDFSRAEEVKKLKAKMGDPDMLSLNTTVLDGRKVTFSDLVQACDAMPFLTDRRLVLVEGLLTRLTGKDKSTGKRSKGNSAFIDELKKYLPNMADTTRLIFLENKSLGKRHPILTLAQKNDAGYVKEFTAPHKGSLNKWIERRVAQKGGAGIDSQAVTELAAFIGDDLRLLDQEIEKLVTFAGAGQSITRKNVREMVTYSQEANIFDMVDALGKKDARAATRLFHDLLDNDGASPFYLLTMIVRQFRILLEVKALQQTAPAASMARELKLHPFVVKKASSQARNFSLPQLHEIYKQLLGLDHAVKTGKTDIVLGLDLFIAQVVSL